MNIGCGSFMMLLLLTLVAALPPMIELRSASAADEHPWGDHVHALSKRFPPMIDLEYAQHRNRFIDKRLPPMLDIEYEKGKRGALSEEDEMMDWLNKVESEGEADDNQVDKRIPPFGLTKRIPPFGLTKRIPPFGLTKRIPPFGLAKRIPPFGLTKRIPPFGLNKRIPPFGLNKRIPPFGLEKRIPPFGLTKRIPPFGLTKRIPPFGLTKRIPPFQLSKKSLDSSAYPEQNELSADLLAALEDFRYKNGYSSSEEY